MFKVGDIVRCVKQSSLTAFETPLNKNYTVLEVGFNFIRIAGDRVSNTSKYASSRFQLAIILDSELGQILFANEEK